MATRASGTKKSPKQSTKPRTGAGTRVKPRAQRDDTPAAKAQTARMAKTHPTRNVPARRKDKDARRP